MPLSSGVALVCNSSSPVMAPTSSVITPPVVETNMERKDRLDSASPTSACPTCSKHLLERGFLGRIYREVPVRLDPDPPPSVLAPVVVVRGFPGFRPLVPLRTVRACVGALWQTAWYRKRDPTFADALALVRKQLWAQEQTFCGSPWEADTIK